MRIPWQSRAVTDVQHNHTARFNFVDDSITPTASSEQMMPDLVWEKDIFGRYGMTVRKQFE